MYFDRFDICEAYLMAEILYNVGGWLQERPSNQRRMESIDVQLHRLGYKPSPMFSLESMSENALEIMFNLIERLGLPLDDELTAIRDRLYS